MQPRIIVDMDNTLYPSQFARVCNRLYGAPSNPDVELQKWEWHTDYGLTDDQFYAAVNVVHASQMDYEPFPGAVEALEAWHAQECHITIATHRKPNIGNFEALINWLTKWNVPYDALFVGLRGKEHLFGEGSIVVDDRPSTIQAAVESGCIAAVTLAHPYVQQTVKDFAPYARMEENWEEIRDVVLTYIRTWEDEIL